MTINFSRSGLSVSSTSSSFWKNNLKTDNYPQTSFLLKKGASMKFMAKRVHKIYMD